MRGKGGGGGVVLGATDNGRKGKSSFFNLELGYTSPIAVRDCSATSFECVLVQKISMTKQTTVTSETATVQDPAFFMQAASPLPLTPRSHNILLRFNRQVCWVSVW